MNATNSNINIYPAWHFLPRMIPNLSVAALRGLVIFYVIRILPRLTPLGYIITPPAEAIIG